MYKYIMKHLHTIYYYILIYNIIYNIKRQKHSQIYHSQPITNTRKKTRENFKRKQLEAIIHLHVVYKVKDYQVYGKNCSQGCVQIVVF